MGSSRSNAARFSSQWLEELAPLPGSLRSGQLDEATQSLVEVGRSLATAIPVGVGNQVGQRMSSSRPSMVDGEIAFSHGRGRRTVDTEAALVHAPVAVGIRFDRSVDFLAFRCPPSGEFQVAAVTERPVSLRGSA
jgi:hypothetical protein